MRGRKPPTSRQGRLWPQIRERLAAEFASPVEISDIYQLRVELPERVRWGELYVAPSIQALQQYEPYGVVLIDAYRARFFVSAFGRMEEEVDAKNVFSTVGWRELTISPLTAAPSGGSATEVFEHRIEAQTLRFYRELGETVRGLIERFGSCCVELRPVRRTSTLRTSRSSARRTWSRSIPARKPCDRHEEQVDGVPVSARHP